MDKDLDQAKGRIKQAVGDLTDDNDLKKEGKTDENAGKVKEFLGDTKDKADESGRQGQGQGQQRALISSQHARHAATGSADPVSCLIFGCRDLRIGGRWGKLSTVSSTRPRVLIVEDDSGVRQALERGLARGGFDTIGAANAADALEADDFDVALVDLGLPDRDGVELCRELRTRFPERPIIVVTGRDDELDVVDALDAGADDYVTKPFSLAVLTATHPPPPRSFVGGHGDRRVAGRSAWRARASLAGEPVELTVREFDLLVASGDARRRRW